MGLPRHVWNLWAQPWILFSWVKPQFCSESLSTNSVGSSRVPRCSRKIFPPLSKRIDSNHTHRTPSWGQPWKGHSWIDVLQPNQVDMKLTITAPALCTVELPSSTESFSLEPIESRQGCCWTPVSSGSHEVGQWAGDISFSFPVTFPTSLTHCWLAYGGKHSLQVKYQRENLRHIKTNFYPLCLGRGPYCKTACVY